MADSLFRDAATREGELAITRDAFYGGRLILSQPATGHRSGTDAILLAAAVPRGFVGRVYDVGAGVGAAGLGIALASPASRVTLVERDAATARLAADNVAANGLADRVVVARCDLLARDERRRALPDAADLVVTNPPFYDAARTRASPVETRRAAHVMDKGATVSGWLQACLDLLAPKGVLIVIHAAAALPDILAALNERAGNIVLKSVHPREGTAARRVLIRAAKGSRAPFAVAPPLVLHGDDGCFAEEADRLHKGEVALSW